MASVESKIGARLRAAYRRSASRDGALARAVRAYRGRGRWNGSLASELAAVRAELDSIRERHGEQIARLEDLSRELARAVETLREDLAGARRER